MKTIITNYRYWVLAMLLCPAITLLVGIPDDGGDIFRFRRPARLRCHVAL